MNDPDRLKLLYGPYTAPALKRRDRTFCLYRDCPVVVRGWSDAPIPWPRCYRPIPRGGCGGLGLLVDEELLRAIRHESATAVAYWWGVSYPTVVRWRRAFAVKRTDSEGTYRLMCSALQATMDARPARGRLWTVEETALVGALPDAEVARLTGRKIGAVHQKRQLLGRPPSAIKGRGRRRRRRVGKGRRAWRQRDRGGTVGDSGDSSPIILAVKGLRKNPRTRPSAALVAVTGQAAHQLLHLQGQQHAAQPRHR